MPNLNAVEIKTFIPAKDFAVSQAFYRDLGFRVTEATEGLCYMCHGNCAALLQDFYEPLHANNHVMHLLVEDVDAWWQQLQRAGIAEKYQVRISAPQDQPYAMRDFTLYDPSGVLWWIGQNT
ncbi:VOC family protein [Parachitinimonas caeni]|uniref:VOC family protein n=1 Tax=Parachitinimonas caeni TaxID=3031301 RepID=A0ABT7DSQ0_9NEIS|nr:VOC family protein [Parachitinimonas caeni]MDK2122984.1 VOC family protein [Parachitinimonas caeni]